MALLPEKTHREAAVHSLALSGAQKLVADPSHALISVIAVILLPALRCLARRRTDAGRGISRKSTNLKLEVRRPGCSCHGNLERHLARRHLVCQMLIESLHSVLLTALGNVVTNFADASRIANKLADSLRHNHDFGGHNPALAVRSGQQPLRHHRGERFREPKAR